MCSREAASVPLELGRRDTRVSKRGTVDAPKTSRTASRGLKLSKKGSVAPQNDPDFAFEVVFRQITRGVSKRGTVDSPRTSRTASVGLKLRKRGSVHHKNDPDFPFEVIHRLPTRGVSKRGTVA
jgi:hypothetical protein